MPKACTWGGASDSAVGADPTPCTSFKREVRRLGRGALFAVALQQQSASTNRPTSASARAKLSASGAPGESLLRPEIAARSGRISGGEIGLSACDWLAAGAAYRGLWRHVCSAHGSTVHVCATLGGFVS